MSRNLLTPWGACLILAWWAGTSPAQSTDPPLLTGIEPPGVVAGEVGDLTIRGRNLRGAKTLILSGPGIEVVEFSHRGDSEARARVRVARGAPLDFCEVRLDGPGGISNLA